MKKLLLPFCLFCYIHTKAQDTAKATAKLTTATVYFGYGAELTHEAKVTVNSGIKQIVLSQLSTSIDPNSLQVSVPENVAILSQQFSIFYPKEENTIISPLISRIQDSIIALQKMNKRKLNMVDIEQTTLDKTGKLIELTITKSDDKKITSDDALKLISAYTTKIEKSKTTVYNLNEEIATINETIEGMNNRISAAAGTPLNTAKPYGQLTMQVICQSASEIPVSLSYFTNNAGWTPLYDVRVSSKTNELKLVYKASVTQTTGIDWKQTKLTLSTGNPNHGGNAPILSAWYLQTYVATLLKDKTSALTMNTIQSMDSKLNEVVVLGYGSQKKAEITGAVQSVDPSTLQRYTRLNENQLNTNFIIDLPYDISSNGNVQTVTIKEEKINATLKNYAVPKLDNDAYLLAEISDWESLNLLPGNANIIMDDTYLGKSFIDANTTADTLNLSLNRDRRIAIKREIVKDYASTKTSGDYTRQLFTYEITVKNNKSTTADMLLKDQFPISREKEIECKLGDVTDAPLINDETGVLTWKLTLKPNESKKVRFSYMIKYPKYKRIEGL